MIKLHNDHSEKDLKKADVYDVHILKTRQAGTNASANKTATIILSMQSTDSKKCFQMAGKKIHESHPTVFVGDDLTVGQRKLLYELKRRNDLYNKVIFRDGAVRCLKKDGGWRQFVYLHELQKLPANGTQPSSEA